VRSLTTAADQFIVARDKEKTVIAGYHWFSDWGRDTMVALPGLTLVTGRFDVARRILLTFAKYVDQGMLPNRFPDAGEQPEYNTVDGTLWYFEAIRAFVDYTGEYEFVRKNIYDVLSDVIDWHLRGTRYGIHVDETGLLTSGVSGVQLTWMDVKLGDWVVTPRYGKPVEIQALWYNALLTMRDLAARFGDSPSSERYAEMATVASSNFNRLFWNENAGCLYDVVDTELPDASIRPNQILAVGLRHSMLSLDRARAVVDVVARELLTPYGLRTLSPLDPRYARRYEGDPPCPGFQLPSRHSLAMALRAVHLRLHEGERRNAGGPLAAGRLARTLPNTSSRSRHWPGIGNL
jgi:predicted glycogen debranching enzyme